MNIIEAIEDPQLFAPWFEGKDSWDTWIIFLAALFAIDQPDKSLCECSTG